jgi:hypothetical protein
MLAMELTFLYGDFAAALTDTLDQDQSVVRWNLLAGPCLCLSFDVPTLGFGFRATLPLLSEIDLCGAAGQVTPEAILSRKGQAIAIR